MALQQRSHTAILAGAKSVIAEVGSYESNMVDIASRAEVSRATVYNHFADKEEMMLTLLESEIERLVELAQKSATLGDALFILSCEISKDPALRKMTETDPTDIAKFVTVGEHRLWALVQESLTNIFGVDNAGFVLHWLLGQVASALTQAQSRHQADQLALALA